MGKGNGATPLTIQALFFGDAISTPTAPTNHLPDWPGFNKFARAKGADKPIDPVLVR
jgi:hypothetical protein